MTARHVYVDESIRPDGWYRLTAVEVAARDVAAVSRQLRQIVPRGQYRVHFSSESDARRRTALRALVDLPISATTFLAPYDRRSDDQIARNICLEALRAVGRDDVAYSHRGSRDELLLALPDALGWAIGARRPWRQMVSEVVAEVRLR